MIHQSLSFLVYVVLGLSAINDAQSNLVTGVTFYVARNSRCIVSAPTLLVTNTTKSSQCLALCYANAVCATAQFTYPSVCSLYGSMVSAMYASVSVSKPSGSCLVYTRRTLPQDAYFNSTAYRLINTTLTRTQAVAYCAKMRMNLWEISSTVEQSYFQSLYPAYKLLTAAVYSSSLASFLWPSTNVTVTYVGTDGDTTPTSCPVTGSLLLKSDGLYCTPANTSLSFICQGAEWASA